MRKAAAVAVLLLGIGSMHGCSCDNTGAGGDDLGDDGGSDVDLSGTVVPSTDGGCTASGQACSTGGQCCSGLCSNNICIAGMCGAAAASCKIAGDCCNLNCQSNGTCGTQQCVSDTQACTAGGTPCCSTQCVNGSCQPLNSTCKTAGNTCGGDGECCSKKCTSGLCASPSSVSYCTQTGDICFHDNECCTGVCTIAPGASAGTCASIATSCAVDGTVCNGCSTTPRCCSSFCAPFGSSGGTICQPASGCHVLGDLCHVTSDCCGGSAPSGLPGAGLVKCVPDTAHPQIGTCSQANPNNCPNGEPTCKNTCQPEGDVCHFKGVGGCSSNSFPANCCGLPGASSGVCKLDSLGVPRCYGIAMCVMPAGACASSADCCNNLPCVPDPNGNLKCGAMCVAQNGSCTTTADCCTGLTCIVPPGSLQGTCANPNPPPPPPPDGGADLAGADLSTPPPPMCALYGQSCSTTVTCCANQGSCLRPYANGSTACAAGDTDCTCYTPLM